MASEIEIANRALSKLGVARLTSLSDNNAQARAVNAAWDLVRDNELRIRRWNFAIARASMAALTSEPVWGFDNEYQLPSDFLALLEIPDAWEAAGLTDYRNSETLPFRIEGTKILTDIAAPLDIRYIYRCDDTSQWDAAFCEAFACKLAYEMCEELTQSNTKKQLLAEDYKQAIRAAARTNAIENPPQPLPDDSWLLSRL